MTEERVKMGVKEADRLGVMKQIDRKNLTLLLTSKQLGFSLRQIKRIRKRYLKEGERELNPPFGLLKVTF